MPKIVRSLEQDEEGRWQCAGCGRWKYPDDFPKNSNTRNGLGAYCKTCHKSRITATSLRSENDTLIAEVEELRRENKALKEELMRRDVEALQAQIDAERNASQS